MVADVGGTSIDDATRRMMKYIFSNELALGTICLAVMGKKSLKICVFSTLCMVSKLTK